jgi:tight adherence protein C
LKGDSMTTMFLPLFGSAMPVVGSALVGCAAAALGWAIVSSRSGGASLTGADAERRAELRKKDPLVLVAEPVFDMLTELNAKHAKASAVEMQRQLDLVYPGQWKSAEYMAASQLQGAAVALGLVLMGAFVGELTSAALFALCTVAMYPTLKSNHLKKLATVRKAKVRSRLPFVLDLTALMMESGALFNACIQTVVMETGKHPIAEELSRVLSSLRQGIPRAAALQEFATRLHDDDVDEVVFAVNTSEELGTPLDKTLRTMADRMRQRRMQDLERKAETAKVHITWPAMLVMVACLIIVAAPLILAGGG